MKTLLILEIGNKKAMPYELGIEEDDGQWHALETGVLPGEGAFEDLKELQTRVDETWVCESLNTGYNLRKSTGIDFWNF